MKKIAILGCENSHANEFLKLIKEGRYPELECIGIYSDQESAARKLFEKFGVEIMARPDSLVGKVDGIIITARDGKDHYPFAKPYLSSAIPMFIDKPFTCNFEEAVAFAKEAREKGVRLCGGSITALWPDTLALKEYAQSCGGIYGGVMAAPIHMDSPYSGFWFYAQHLVQMVMAVFGSEIRAVNARLKGDCVDVMFRYDQFEVSGLYLSENKYYGQVRSQEGDYEREIEFCAETFAKELDSFCRLLNGEGMEEKYEDLIRPVLIIEAIEKAYLTQKEIEIKEILL